MDRIQQSSIQQRESNDKALGSGAIAGIAVGLAVALLLVAAAVTLGVRRRRRSAALLAKKEASAAPGPAGSIHAPLEEPEGQSGNSDKKWQRRSRKLPRQRRST